MSDTPGTDEINATDATDQQDATEQQQDAMRDRLRKDVASWSSARHDGSARHVAEFGAPIGTPAPTTPPVRKAKPAKPAAAQAAPVAKDGKPFRMSYGGTTTADYVRYMLERGGR